MMDRVMVVMKMGRNEIHLMKYLFS